MCLLAYLASYLFLSLFSMCSLKILSLLLYVNKGRAGERGEGRLHLKYHGVFSSCSRHAKRKKFMHTCIRGRRSRQMRGRGKSSGFFCFFWGGRVLSSSSLPPPQPPRPHTHHMNTSSGVMVSFGASSRKRERKKTWNDDLYCMYIDKLHKGY